MSEMIERVARAICEDDGFGWESLLAGDAIAIRQRKYFSLARAAIAAMREPTEAMISVGAHEDGRPTAISVWNVMIDEALPFYAKEYGQSFVLTDPMNSEATQALLIPAMDAAQKAMSETLNRSLYAQFDWKPAAPQPWHLRKIKLFRRRLGEKIADFASWVAGYDVRGDW